jgi:hypothetical protein
LFDQVDAGPLRSFFQPLRPVQRYHLFLFRERRHMIESKPMRAAIACLRERAG